MLKTSRQEVLGFCWLPKKIDNNIKNLDNKIELSIRKVSIFEKIFEFDYDNLNFIV